MCGVIRLFHWWPAQLFLAVLACSRVIAAEVPRFERLGSEHGLSHNCVLTILQDRDGFLWLGTLDGLNRYDGFEFVILRHHPGAAGSLSNNIVRALHEDSQGRLWVGTESGVDRLDDTRTRAIHYRLAADGEVEPVVRTFFEARDGTLWAGTSRGLFRLLPPASDRFELWASKRGDGRSSRGLPHAGVLRLQEDASALWVLTSDTDTEPTRASLSRLAPATGETRDIPLATAGRQVYDFLIDGAGTMWIDAGFDPPPGLFSGDLQAGPGRLAATPVWALFEDASGAVWVGSESGLGHAAPTQGANTGESGTGAYDPGWLGGFVLAIHQDSAGALWLGTLGGLYHSEPAAKPFRNLRHVPGDPTSLAVDAISAVVESTDPSAAGRFWVGTFGGGVDLLDSELRQVGRFRHDADRPGSLCDDLVWSLYLDDGPPAERLWLGTESGLCSLDVETHEGRRHDVPIPDGRGLQSRVTAIAAAPDGTLWLGTFSGLVHFDPADERAVLYPPTGDARGPGDREISSLLSHGGELWVGTVSGNFDHVTRSMKSEELVFRHHHLVDARGMPIRTEGIFDLLRDASGALWLATGAGLHRFDIAASARGHGGSGHGDSRHFSTWDGLPGSVVYSVAEGSDGRLWLGTNQGLSSLALSPEGEARFRNYSFADGIGNQEFNRGAALAGSDGRLVFGGTSGLTLFDPRQVEDDPFEPPVAITRIQAEGRDGSIEVPARALDRLVVPPGRMTVNFEFSAISFLNAADNRYLHRLDGFDDDWIDAGHRRFARYTNVPPGDYVFRVRGSNHDGVWSRAVASLPVTVQPTIWQTTWFRAGFVASLVLLAALAYRYRVRSLLAVERLRVRIAGDLHDDLSSELSAIALAADVMERRPDLGDHDRSRLGEMRLRALSMVDSLRDIVWYVNPEHDNLEATVRRARSLARSLLPDADLRFEASVAPTRRISMGDRRELYLLLKEALHNVARHAGARTVEVLLEVDGHSLHLWVRDDGRGFDPAQIGDGDGLRNLRARARRLGAELRIKSVVGRGTAVEVRTPRAGAWRGFGMAEADCDE